MLVALDEARDVACAPGKAAQPETLTGSCRPAVRPHGGTGRDLRGPFSPPESALTNNGNKRTNARTDLWFYAVPFPVLIPSPLPLPRLDNGRETRSLPKPVSALGACIALSGRGRVKPAAAAAAEDVGPAESPANHERRKA